MGGPMAALWRTAHAEAPLAVIIYRDPAAREDWVDEVRLLISQGERAAEAVSSLDELLGRPDVSLLVLPPPEQEADLVGQLAVVRDQLNRRTAELGVERQERVGRARIEGGDPARDGGDLLVIRGDDDPIDGRCLHGLPNRPGNQRQTVERADVLAYEPLTAAACGHQGYDLRHCASSLFLALSIGFYGVPS